MALKFHHIAVATSNIIKTSEIYKKLGFELGNTYDDLIQQVQVQFAQADKISIELVTPLSDNSPIKNILNKIGTSPYHVCFLTDDFDNDYKYLLELGFIDLTGCKPAKAFDNKNIVFLYNDSFGLIEIVDEK
ncbi:MAG TPA: VOC family protein [Melioribacteraceae bacterium]|nr:VOC family protein [Melioribacteraceae bacterium]